MIVIGLTGGVGMGKSTTTKLFAEEGVPVWDADAAVHRLYQPGGDAVLPVVEAFPGTGSKGAGIDRAALGEAVLGDAKALQKLESIVHPMVRTDRLRFIKDCAARGEKLVICDIPLLLEGEGRDMFDTLVVVSAPEEVRRERVMARSGMTEEKYAAIVGRQMPDAEKRALADYIIMTDSGVDSARSQVRAIIAELLGTSQIEPE
ncbi:dephospho-CoA kinase [Parvularcula sp. LCG005]|uniref:dephospho-CoA kinase n=1 Tax=Parvularcula sp. LCG005 TaxID=3078805 RepID=UPI002943B45B|nr:dephospho-CoA kinase [Parvularcula sp. LCG005]WOI53315.1 dephospho-CoA kinase [Parvularcula sp. LCG005]